MEQITGVNIAREVPSSVQWVPDDTLRLVDQTALPSQLRYLDLTTVDDVAAAIRSLQVRGAPAIGLAAAYALAMVACRTETATAAALLSDLEKAGVTLKQTRPTAVNLAWALDMVLSAAREAARLGDPGAVRAAVLSEAHRIEEQNSEASRHMGEFGAALLHGGMDVLTHCNTGPLAAGGTGSALGVLYRAHRQGKQLHVWVDETRPLLQGARLTTWELGQWGIPCTLIADSMAASLMRAGRVGAVLVGADRIAANGDVANKIGSYGLAVLAHAHDIPFYVVAPSSTIDPSIPTGNEIKIEERKAEEITHHGGMRLAPDGVQVYNPAFDVTPSHLVTAIVTEVGVLRPPYELALEEAWQASHGRPATTDKGW